MHGEGAKINDQLIFRWNGYLKYVTTTFPLHIIPIRFKGQDSTVVLKNAEDQKVTESTWAARPLEPYSREKGCLNCFPFPFLCFGNLSLKRVETITNFPPLDDGTSFGILGLPGRSRRAKSIAQIPQYHKEVGHTIQRCMCNGCPRLLLKISK